MTGILDALNRALDADASSRDLRDATIVELARTYAGLLDDADAIEDSRADTGKAYRADVIAQYGPLLQSALVELHMTPRARAAVTAPKGAGGEPAKRSALDELKARRRARIDGTAPVDATPS